jgi:RND family efflux transporter MFP subunit
MGKCGKSKYCERIKTELGKNKMRNLKKVKLIMSLAVVLFVTGCGANGDEKTEVTQKNVTDTIAVTLANVEIKDLAVVKSFNGNLEGEEQANIVGKIPERITAVNVKVGDYVKTGQLLVQLDKSGASSQYFQAEAGYLNSQKDLERMKSLYSEGAISQQMLDGVQTQYNIAKANFDAAKNSVDLTSPITGVVTEVNVNIGDLASPGIPLVVVANISKMKAIINVGEADIPNFAVGQSAEVYSELKPELKVKGRIIQISKSADINSRSFEGKVLFSNTGDKWFKPGMFCRVNVELFTKNKSLVVPNSAIINKENEKGIFVAENGIAVFKNVSIGITDGVSTEIKTGIKKEDKIITLGNANLKNGQPIQTSSN